MQWWWESRNRVWGWGIVFEVGESGGVTVIKKEMTTMMMESGGVTVLKSGVFRSYFHFFRRKIEMAAILEKIMFEGCKVIKERKGVILENVNFEGSKFFMSWIFERGL